MRRIPTSLLFIICSLFFSVSAWAQSDDIEVTDSTSTGWDDGPGGEVNPQEPNDPVTSLTISQTSLTLEGGDCVRLVATVNQRAKNKNIIWTSANSEIASVDDNGTVTGLTKGQTVITATAEGNTSIKASCKVIVTSNYEGMRLPALPFEFCFNAFDYNETIHSIPNHPKANLKGASLVLTENLPEKVNGGKALRFNDRCEGYINLWDKWSNESGAYFYRGGQDCMTIVAKVAPRLNTGNACDFVTNRGNNHNYMWRIGENNTMFLHTDIAYEDWRLLPLTSEQPQILAVRVDGVNDYILLQNLTTGDSNRVNGVNWGGGDNVFKLFYNHEGEYWLGDFYWVYYSFELLTDSQLAILAAESQGSGKKGDANGDGKVDVADIATIISIMAGTALPTANADANGDGKVDVADIATVISIMAGQ